MTTTEPRADVAGGDSRHGVLLALEDLGGAAVAQHLVGHGALLDHGAVGGEVAEEHGQAAGGVVGLVEGPDHVVVDDAGAGHGLGDGAAGHAEGGAVHEAGVDELLHDGLDAAGVVQVFHVVSAGRRELADVRHPRRDLVDALQVELEAGLGGDRRQVQHGVGAAAQAGVGGQGVADRRVREEVARLEVGGQHVHDLGAGVLGEAQALAVGRRDRAVAGQRHADDLGEAVHGVGGEHARARAAGGAGAALDGLEALVVERAGLVAAHGLEHAVEVDGAPVQVAGEHRPAADHDGRHVEAHGGHEHAGHDLVAGGHEHERVEGVGDGHRLDRVGDELAAGQRVVHAQMVHGDAVADAHHAELQGHAAGAAHAGLDGVDDAAQVHVAGHHFAEGVGDADERPLHLGVADAQRAQQRAVRGARHAAFDLVASHDHHALSAGTGCGRRSRGRRRP